MIELIKYIVLGFVQGVAEVLPISSSGHLAIVQNIMGIDESQLTFEVFLHLASLIAIVFFLRKTIWKLLRGFCLYVFKKDKEYVFEFKYCLFIVISTIPLVLASLLVKDLVAQITTVIWAVGIFLMINALLLYILPKFQGNRGEKDLNFVDAIVIGCFQVVGVFPGISRSGSCLCGGFSRKLDKNTAAQYAFVMFLPAAFGSFVLEADNMLNIFNGIDKNTLVLYIISFLVTLVVTYFSFKVLLAVVRKGKFEWFSIYCLLMGLFAFAYGLMKM